jgi:hypothetical protein
VETLAGCVYSTSFLNREVLGPLAADFEQELAQLLGPFASDGVLHEETSCAYELAQGRS